MRTPADVPLRCLALATWLVFLPTGFKACTQVFPTYKVRPRFSVSVMNGSSPVIGKQLRVLDTSGNNVRDIRSEITDRQGVAHFEMVTAGHYLIQAADGHGDAAELDVALDGEDQILTLKWPEMPVLNTRNARGRMRLANDLSPVSAKVSLLDAISLKQVASGEVNGSFDLGSVPDGLYWLRVVQPEKKQGEWMKVNGDVAIQVDSSSSTGELDVAVGRSSCGLYYSNNCRPTKPLTVRGLCVTAVDTAGATIRRTGLQLKDERSSRAISLGETDENGTFELRNDSREGNYTLSLLPPVGFTGIEVPIELQRGSCGTPLRVTLGYSVNAAVWT